MAAPPGNKNPTTGKEIRDAIRYEVAKIGRTIEGDEPALKKGMRKVAAPLVAQAIDGNPQAFKEIADRIDGKAPQSIDLSGELEIPLSGVVKFVKSSD